MKKVLLRFLNSCISVFNVRIIRSDLYPFDMDHAIQRISERGIEVQSVFDIGASNGKWSQDAMKIFPGAKFVGLEPLAERESGLKELSESSENFEYSLCVASDSNQAEVSLSVSDDLDGSTVNGEGMDNRVRMVPAKTLDTLASEHKLKGPYLLKFDTHGYEIPILEGAAETLSDTNVIIMEVYNFKLTEQSLRFHEMCAHLEELGFRSIDMAGPMLRSYDNALWQMDLIFARKEEQCFDYNAYR